MGIFSKIKRAFKKITSGIGRAIKKVVKGIGKVAKSILKPIGKVFGKLGPIGTLAIGFIVPWAVGAMATMGGTIGAIGKGLQAVGKFATAPIRAAGKLVGNAVGAGAQAIGNAVGTEGLFGQGINSITSKVANLVGYNGSGVTSGVTDIFRDAAVSMDSAFGTSLSPASTTRMTEFGLSSSTMNALEAGANDGTLIQGGSEQFNILSEQDRMFALDNYNPSGLIENSEQYKMLAKQDAGIGGSSGLLGNKLAAETQQAAADSVGGEVVEPTNSLLSRITKGLGGLSPTTPATSLVIPTIGDTESAEFNPKVNLASQFGAQGRSFFGQDLTGLMDTELFSQKAFSLLGRGNV